MIGGTAKCAAWAGYWGQGCRSLQAAAYQEIRACEDAVALFMKAPTQLG